MNVILHSRLKLEAIPPEEAIVYVEAGWISSTKVAAWKLEKDFIISYGQNRHVIPAGFVTDLSSIPRFMWRLYPPSFPYSREASIPHDYIYRLGWKEYSKEYADQMFRDIMLYQGASSRDAWKFHKAVSWFGKGGWNK